MAALSEEITVNRTLAALAVVKGPEHRLLSLFLSMSKNGREKLYATAAYYRRVLKIARSTYYNWRRKLVRMGLVDVEERRTERCYSHTSLISVCSVATISRRLYEQIQSVRCPTFWTQIPSLTRKSNGRAKINDWRPSPTTQRLVSEGLRHNRRE